LFFLSYSSAAHSSLEVIVNRSCSPPTQPTGYTCWTLFVQNQPKATSRTSDSWKHGQTLNGDRRIFN